MSRRRNSSMPAGMVIAALAVIALVALAALFVFGGQSEGAQTYRGMPAFSASGMNAGPE